MKILIQKGRKKPIIIAVVAVILAIAGFFSYEKIVASDAPLVTNIELDPSLDISRFASYDALASIDRFPQGETATVALSGINGDGGSHWDHYADGTTSAQDVVKNMTYDPSVSKWRSTNIYPDSIYPEIFFMPSAVAWNNAPLNTIVRRNNYQLMHIANPYTSTGEMSFWIELNAYRQSQVNSANLQVYLVEKGHDINFFQQDWRALPGVELVGAITKDAVVNHTHTANSSHHIVRLGSNPDGSFGVNNLDIQGDFWLILYSTSPNDARGYDLRYQPSSLCNNNGRWYSGSQSGWTTTLMSGCPDAHVHIARRSSTGGIRDGVQAVVSASYQGETGAKTSTFYYNELPNLAPNSTVFRNPVLGGTYAGDIDVAWDPASDPNNDPLKYTIYLYDSNNNQVGDALITDTSNTSFTFSTNTTGSEIPNGDYYLKGQVCDQEPLCSEFVMPRTFTIDNVSPIRSITSISISSNNTNPSYAKAGDTVTLSFTTSAAITPPNVGIYSGGHILVNDITVSSSDNIHWTASYLVSPSGTTGEVSFEIGSTSLDKDYYETTDGTKVTVDNVSPTVATYLPPDGSDGASVDTDLVFTFAENVEVVSGKNLLIKKVADDSVIQTIALDGEQVVISNSTVTINPITNLEDKTEYYVIIDAGSFKDIAGNTYLGISNKTAWNFTVGDITKPTLQSVAISSSNVQNFAYASPGDTVTLLFTASEAINAPAVMFKVGEIAVKNTPTITNSTGNSWIASFSVDSDDPEGDISFTIDFSDLHANSADQVTSTTDSSSVTITKQAIPTATSTMSLSATPTPIYSSSDTPIATATATSTAKPSSPSQASIQSVSSTVPAYSGSATRVATTRSPYSEETEEYGSVLDLFEVKLKVLKNNKPATGLKVELYSNVRESITDVHGEVAFANVEAGRHVVKIYDGKKVATKEINVTGDYSKPLQILVDITPKNYYYWHLLALIILLTLAAIFIIYRGTKRV